jgi:two-component system chemotaxis response regulator CheB
MSLRPCVDNLFISAAAQFKERLIGVILTGMGSDGAKGCLEIKKNNGFTIAQDEATSVVFGMARVAIEKNGISVVLSLDAISRYLIEITSR